MPSGLQFQWLTRVDVIRTEVTSGHHVARLRAALRAASEGHLRAGVSLAPLEVRGPLSPSPRSETVSACNLECRRVGSDALVNGVLLVQ